MLGSNVYMSDLIGDAYTTWKDCLVILNGGTGSGKSYFVINVLIPYYVNQNKQILYLCNREKLEYQSLSTCYCMDVSKIAGKVAEKKKIAKV